MSRSGLLNTYSAKARLTPAALCAIPFLVLYHYLLQAHYQGFVVDLDRVRFLGYLTIEAAGTYFVMQLNNRLGGKLLQSYVFCKKGMPSTQLLMPGNALLSKQTKQDVADKFKRDFGKELPIFDSNISDTERGQRLTELTAYIRDATRPDMLVKNHNAEYGFVRNLCGGSIVAALVSLGCVVQFGVVNWDKPAFVVSTVLLVTYGIIMAASKPLITYFGMNYARVLIEQYLCTTK